jgi:tetratricopeptide (TPR) repeat protein
VKDFLRTGAAALAFSAFLMTGNPILSLPAFADSKSYQRDLTRGLYQMNKKDYESAVASFTLVLRDNPGVYEAYLNRAQGRSELRDFEGALSDYDQAIKINPNVVESYIKRADLHTKMSNYQLAVDDYSLALRLNPKNVDAVLNRGAAYKKIGDYQKAINDFSSALKLEPGSYEAIKERADCRAKSNDLDGAVEDYEYLLKKNKYSATALRFNLGEVFLAKGAKGSADENFKQVIAYYNKSLKGSRKDGNSLLQRGLAYAKLGEIDKAISDLQEASAWKSDEALTKYNLGRLKLVKGDSKGAIADLTEAIRVNPKYSPALMDRASAYAAAGEYMNAQKDLDAALSGEKTVEGFYNRAMARLAIGDSSGAVSDIAEAKNYGAQYVINKKAQLQEQISAKETKGERDIALSDLLEQVVLIELGENNADVAEALEKRALGIKEKQLSKHDPKLAHSYMMLGRVYMKKKSPTKAEALFRTAMTRLKGTTDGTQKFAIFNLEDCAKLLIQSSQQEEAGAILVDTRMARAVSSMNDRAFSGDLSRKAERAIEAFKKRKRAAEQKELAEQVQPEGTEPMSVRRVDAEYGTTVSASATSSPSAAAATSAALSDKAVVNKPIRDKWALIVGISNFKDSSINLHYCAKDAKDFYDFLVTEKNFAPDHVQLLTDSTATRANILSLLGNKWLPRVAEPDDLVVIYFSSHGSPSSLDVGGVNYLVAHDTDINDLYVTGIAMQDLSRIIKERVHCDRVMVLLDACHSGVAAPSSKGLARSGNVNVDTIVQGTGQLVLSSSSPDQRSWESKRYQGSVFTKHLIEGLRRDGKMTKLGQAFNYLNEEVQREVMRDRGVLQNPVMKSKWEGDDLVIGVPPAKPSKGLSNIELPDQAKNVTTTGAEPTRQSKEGRPKASSTRRAR